MTQDRGLTLKKCPSCRGIALHHLDFESSNVAGTASTVLQDRKPQDFLASAFLQIATASFFGTAWRFDECFWGLVGPLAVGVRLSGKFKEGLKSKSP